MGAKTRLAFALLIGAGVAVLLATWPSPERTGDVAAVRVGFAGYTETDGKHYVILIITNHSSFSIKKPEAEDCRVFCEYPDGANFSGGSQTIACGFGTPRWGWWQLKAPRIPNIAPGKQFRLLVPIHAESLSWRVTIPLSTIPFKDRLPYALRSRLPASPADVPVYFDLIASHPPASKYQ
jgi:hypothetical protein